MLRAVSHISGEGVRRNGCRKIETSSASSCEKLPGLLLSQPGKRNVISDLILHSGKSPERINYDICLNCHRLLKWFSVVKAKNQVWRSKHIFWGKKLEMKIIRWSQLELCNNYIFVTIFFLNSSSKSQISKMVKHENIKTIHKFVNHAMFDLTPDNKQMKWTLSILHYNKTVRLQAEISTFTLFFHILYS